MRVPPTHKSTGLKSVIVVDLDGTLFDSAHREHLAREKRWTEFHELLTLDPVKPDVARIIQQLQRDDDTFILGCTGRPERYRPLTLAKLTAHNLELDDLLMRPDNDWAPDHELKPRMVIEYFVDKEAALLSVNMVLEDRDKVVEAWRNLGFKCWQVSVGGY